MGVELYLGKRVVREKIILVKSINKRGLSLIFTYFHKETWMNTFTPNLEILPIYRKTLQYKIVRLFQVLARSLMITSLFIFILGTIFNEQSHFHVGIIVFLMGCGFSLFAALLAIGLKCGVCHKRAAVVFRNRKGQYRYKAKNDFEALINDFYPIEIRQGRFRCVNCGSEYLLK